MEVLKNKSYKSYDRVSRYTQFPYYYHSRDNKYIYSTTTQLDNTTYYILHKVKRGDTFDTLALDYYNNPTYYWVIMDFNRFQDPFEKLIVGMYIKIPTLSTIKFDT